MSFKSVFVFKRFQNKGYSLFRTLGKIVFILVLPLAYLSFWAVKVNAQDTVNLKKITVNATRLPSVLQYNYRPVKVITQKDFSEAPMSDITSALNYLGGVQIAARGMQDVQTDLSINGSQPDQILILLNGFKINDLQTGHFNLNLPISLYDISQIEILQGADASLYGVNAFAGAINFSTLSATKNFTKMRAIVGQNNFLEYNFAMNFAQKKQIHFLSFNKSFSSGYMPDTDFDIYKFFYSTKYKTKNFDYFFQTGILWKNFGALNFYSPKFPYQFEHNNTEIASLSINQKPLKIKLLASWRRNQDRFELFREGQNWYVWNNGYFIKDNDTAWLVEGQVPYTKHNYHATNNFYLELLKTFETKFGTTVISAAEEYYIVRSTLLGDSVKPVKAPFEKGIYFTKGAEQNYQSLGIYHKIRLKHWLFAFSTKVVASSVSQTFDQTFGINTAYFTNDWKFFANFNRALRYPTFTELYYKDAVHQGNPNLSNEINNSFEAGFNLIKKYHFLQISGYYSKRQNLIDWSLENGVYYAKNWGEITIYGINLTSKINLKKAKFKFVKSLIFNYSYTQLYKTQNIGFYLSSLPWHYFSFGINAGYKQFYASVSGSYFKFVPGSVNSQIFVANALVGVKLKKYNIFLGVENFTDEHYIFYYTPMPGSWFKFGVEKKF